MPAGTPADVVARLNREIARYLEGSDIRERLLAIGLATEGGGTPETTAQAVRREQELWRALAKELRRAAVTARRERQAAG